MSNPDKFENIFGWVVIVAVLAGIICFVGGTYVAIKDHNHHNRFEGACVVQGGTVEDDLCIKDNQVILRLDDVK